MITLKKHINGDNLRSKPIRENEIAIETAYNDLENQINSITTAGTLSEITNARDLMNTLQERIQLLTQCLSNAIVECDGVTEQATPDMTVLIGAGSAIVNGVGVKWSAQTSATITAPATDSRTDSIIVDDTGTISIVDGGVSFSDLTDSQQLIASVTIDSTTTAITDDMITQYIFSFVTTPLGVKRPIHDIGDHANYVVTLDSEILPLFRIVSIKKGDTVGLSGSGADHASDDYEYLLALMNTGNPYSRTSGWDTVATSDFVGYIKY